MLQNIKQISAFPYDYSLKLASTITNALCEITFKVLQLNESFQGQILKDKTLHSYCFFIHLILAV